MVSSFPPAIGLNEIESDDQDSSHVKLVGNVKLKKVLFVLFFETCEHAWVSENFLIKYKGVEAFKTFAQEQVNLAKSKSSKDRLIDKYQLKINLSRQNQWDSATLRADAFVNKPASDRKLFFACHLKKLETKKLKNQSICESGEEINRIGVVSASRKSLSSPLSSNQKDLSKPECVNLQEDENNNESMQNKNPKKSPKPEVPAQSLLESFETIEPKIETTNNCLIRLVDTNVPEISDELTLTLIKQRLTALTLIDKILTRSGTLSLEKLAHDYDLTTDSLMIDYFGFNDHHEDTLAADETFKKFETIKSELEHSLNGGWADATAAASKENAENQQVVSSSYLDNLVRVPKALIALKYKTPMLFVNKLSAYLLIRSWGYGGGGGGQTQVLVESENVLSLKERPLNEKMLKQNSVKQQPLMSSDQQFYGKLIELQKKLYSNRMDLNSMIEILNKANHDLYWK
jgi:hypothetical protein